MFYWSLIIILIGIYSSYIFGKSRIKKNSIAANIKSVSLPTYYAQYMLFWCLLPALIVYFGWIIFEDQIISLSLYSNLGIKENFRSALKHFNIIRKFGRFPHRNKILNRKSTDEELAFLKTPGSSF